MPGPGSGVPEYRFQNHKHRQRIHRGWYLVGILAVIALLMFVLF